MLNSLTSKLFFLSFSLLAFTGLRAQTLENVIVEEYADGSAGVGLKTYRVFIDMGEGDVLLAVYGFDDADPETGNPISFNTTTTFFQSSLGGNFGETINSLLFTIPGFESSAYDSWVSVGGAAIGQAAIPLVDDSDGLSLNGNTPDGYAAADVSSTNSVGFTFPGAASVSMIETSDGAYFIAGGASGVGPNNTICIGQFTTDGDFSFEINIQLQNGDDEVIYLHTNAEQPDGTIGVVSPFLTFPLAGITGCTNSEACNFNFDATLDDGSCIIPVENCTECNEDNTALDLIDVDGDGVCDAEEVTGCTNPLSCNFDNSATDDDGSCSDLPVTDCSFCLGQELVIIDADGDEVCDADDECPFLADLVNGDECVTEGGEPGFIAGCECELEIIEGCTSPSACNFDPQANLDDNSCLEPTENCLECNETNDDLVIIDTDGDGVCDAEEVLGCIDPLDCNFNADATELDDSCAGVPEENCTECDDVLNELVLIDDDGDGVCNSEEIAGCMDALANNYNPDATDDDGSCEYDEVLISVAEFDCGEGILQVTGALSGFTNGGEATSQTRTIYTFESDADDNPSYTGASWPYVQVLGDLNIDASISAALTISDANILLVNGRPAYQYSNDMNENDATGNFGPWSYFLTSGDTTQNPCPVSTFDANGSEAKIVLAPNPSSADFRLSLQNARKLNGFDLVTVVVFDIIGNRVFEDIVAPSELDSYLIHGKAWNSGIYLLQLITQDFKVTTKIVKVD